MKANRCHRSFLRDDRAVADVVGSILLVGITVASAGALSLLVLSIDGPSGTIHVSLDAKIGPGDDNDWGVDDAELRVRHLGGEPLRAEDTLIRLRYPDGAVVSIVPDFNAGVLLIGQQWTKAISAEEGENIALQIIGHSGSRSQLLLESADVRPTATAFNATYATGFTAIAGTLSNFIGAQSANDADSTAVIDEAPVGGGGGAATLSGTSAVGTGATNPENALGSDDARSIMAASGTWVEATGFAAPGGATGITQVLIGLEGHGPVSPSLVNHEATVGYVANVAGSIDSPLVTAVADQFYLAAIENGDTSKRTVTRVDGLNLAWTRVAGGCADEAVGGCVEVWKGSGNPVTGIVTAQFSGSADKAAIAVSRYSGVDLGAPIIDSVFTQHPTTSGSADWSTPAVTGVGSGRLYVALGSHDREGSTWDNPTSVRDSRGISREVWLSIADGPSAAGANVASGTLIGGADDWHAVALTLQPIVPPAPKVTISYHVGGANGPTDRLVTLTGSDRITLTDITGDRAWTTEDIAALDIRVTASDTAGGPVLIDHLFVRVATTGAAAYEGNVEMAFDGIPDQPTHRLDLRYRIAAPGDAFRVEVQNATTWRACTGNLASSAYASFSCALNPDETASLSPRIRFVDVDPFSATPGALYLEYARITSS